MQLSIFKIFIRQHNIFRLNLFRGTISVGRLLYVEEALLYIHCRSFSEKIVYSLAEIREFHIQSRMLLLLNILNQSSNYLSFTATHSS